MFKLHLRAPRPATDSCAVQGRVHELIEKLNINLVDLAVTKWSDLQGDTTVFHGLPIKDSPEILYLMHQEDPRAVPPANKPQVLAFQFRNVLLTDAANVPRCRTIKINVIGTLAVEQRYQEEIENLAAMAVAALSKTEFYIQTPINYITNHFVSTDNQLEDFLTILEEFLTAPATTAIMTNLRAIPLLTAPFPLPLPPRAPQTPSYTIPSIPPFLPPAVTSAMLPALLSAPISMPEAKTLLTLRITRNAYEELTRAALDQPTTWYTSEHIDVLSVIEWIKLYNKNPYEALTIAVYPTAPLSFYNDLGTLSSLENALAYAPHLSHAYSKIDAGYLRQPLQNFQCLIFPVAIAPLGETEPDHYFVIAITKNANGSYNIYVQCSYGSYDQRYNERQRQALEIFKKFFRANPDERSRSSRSSRSSRNSSIAQQRPTNQSDCGAWAVINIEYLLHSWSRIEKPTWPAPGSIRDVRRQHQTMLVSINFIS